MSKAMSGYGVRAGIIRRKYLPLSTDTVYIIKHFEIGTFTPQIYSFKNLKRLENKKANDAKKHGQIMCFYVFLYPEWGKQNTNPAKPSGGALLCHVFHIGISPQIRGPQILRISSYFTSLGAPLF